MDSALVQLLEAALPSGVGAAALSWFVTHRTYSGKVEDSQAADLWREGEAFRRALLDRIGAYEREGLAQARLRHDLRNELIGCQVARGIAEARLAATTEELVRERLREPMPEGPSHDDRR